MVVNLDCGLVMLSDEPERDAGQVVLLQKVSDPLHERFVCPRCHSGLRGEDLEDSFREAHPLQFLFYGKGLVFDLGNGDSFGLRAAHVKEKGE